MSDELTLHIHGDGDLVLPAELLNATLPAGELVALIAFFAFQEGHYDFADKLFKADSSGEVARSLRDRGILHVDQAESKITIRLDLTKLPI